MAFRMIVESAFRGGRGHPSGVGGRIAPAVHPPVVKCVWCTCVQLGAVLVCTSSPVHQSIPAVLQHLGATAVTPAFLSSVLVLPRGHVAPRAQPSPC